MRRFTALLAALALVAAACGSDDEDPAATTTTTTEGTTTTTSEPATTSTTEPDDAALPGGELEPCEHPDGFVISAPASWSVNEGDVVPECSQFDPEPFEVPRGTDERVAAITAFVDPVPFSTAAAPQDGRDEDRAVTVVDGREAVRVSYEVDDGLYPSGTPITVYMVDVTPEGGEPATLFVDTVGLSQFDYDTNVIVLDRMVETLDITGMPVEADPGSVAAYRGGGGGFTVVAMSSGGEVCLRIPPEGDEVCTDAPEADQVHTLLLEDLERDVQAGVTGEDVWRVDLVTSDGDVHSYLPADVTGTELGAYAFADTVDPFQRLELLDVTSEAIRSVEPGSA